MVRVRVGVRVGARVRARVTEGDGRRQLGDLITERGTLEDGLWVGGAAHLVRGRGRVRVGVRDRRRGEGDAAHLVRGRGQG